MQSSVVSIQPSCLNLVESVLVADGVDLSDLVMFSIDFLTAVCCGLLPEPIHP